MKVFAVDPAANREDWHVYKNYSVTLNLTDITYGTLGNNKYYIIQLLERNDKKKFSCFTWYGRVGNAGVANLEDFYSLADCQEAFEEKFLAKTGN